MMTTNLSCSVQNCVNYDDNMCVRHDIKVDGHSAREKNGTCCSSFAEREDSTWNMSNAPQAEPETGIRCDALHCVYNHNKDCTADAISISGDGASVCEETRCSTFKLGK